MNNNQNPNEWRSQWDSPGGNGGPGDAAPQPMAPGLGKPKKSPVVILIAVVVVLLLAVAGVLAYLLVNGTSLDNNARQSPVTATSTVVVEETVSPSASSGPVQSQSQNQSPQARPTPSSEPAVPAAARAAGVTSSGWADNASVDCAAGEDLIYAGRGNSAWVTVCESGSGQMTYRSDVFDGNLTANVTAANPGVGQFIIDAAPSLIAVENDVLRVYQDGAMVSEEQLPSSWVLG